MSHEYSENILVQESAGNLQRDELGWDVVFAYNREVLGSTGTLRRSSYKEAVLTRYLEKASTLRHDHRQKECKICFEKLKNWVIFVKNDIASLACSFSCCVKWL